MLCLICPNLLFKIIGHLSSDVVSMCFGDYSRQVALKPRRSPILDVFCTQGTKFVLSKTVGF